MIDHDVNTYIEVMPESSFWNCFRAYFNYWVIRVNQNLKYMNLVILFFTFLVLDFFFKMFKFSFD